MWPLYKKPKLITVTLSPGYMSLSLMQITKQIEIQAYQKIDLKNLEFENSILFNFTKIAHIIKTFLNTHNLKNATMAVSLVGPHIREKSITVATASPSKDMLKIDNIKNMQWKHTYIGPSLQNGFDFYVCGIKRELLFQCNLLAIKSGTKLSAITTPKVAHIQLYKHLKGELFSQTKLAIDLSKNYEVLPLLLSEAEKKITPGPDLSIDLKKEIPALSTHIGLFLLGKNYE